MPANVKLGSLAVRYTTERAARREVERDTARTVLYTLRGFIDIVGDMEADELDRSHVELWLERTPHSPSTTRNRLSQIRTFCEWLVDNDHLVRNPVRARMGPTQPHYLPRSLQHPSVSAAFLACPDARAELVISLAVQECLRVGEIAKIQIGDVDFDNREVLVHGKGRRERVVPLSDETLAALERYLDEHPASAGPLIRSYNHPHRPITPAYVSTLAARWIRAGGTNATGHQLRHTGATDMKRRGVPLEVIQEMLGHALISTTQIYVGRVVSAELRAGAAGRRYRGPHPIDEEPSEQNQQELPLVDAGTA